MKFLMGMIKGALASETVIDDLTAQEREWVEYTKPILDKVHASLNNVELKGDAGKIVNKLTNELDNRQSTTAVIVQGTATVVDKITLLKGLAEKEIGARVTSESNNYRIANVVRLCSSIDAMQRFIRLAVRLIMSEQTSTVDVREKSYIQDVEWLRTNADMFKQTLRMLALTSDEISARVRRIPEVELTEESKLRLAGIQMTTVDPFAMRFLPVSINPAYLIGRRVVEFQDARYQSAKAQLELANQQIRLYSSQRGGDNDAALEKAIEFYTEQVEKYEYKIAKYESRYGI